MEVTTRKRLGTPLYSSEREASLALSLEPSISHRNPLEPLLVLNDKKHRSKVRILDHWREPVEPLQPPEVGVSWLMCRGHVWVLDGFWGVRVLCWDWEYDFLKLGSCCFDCEAVQSFCASSDSCSSASCRFVWMVKG